MQLNTGQKKCLQIFKTFVQKSFLPHLKSTNGPLSEWNIFQTLISAPNISINQLQSFVESLSSSQPPKTEKMPLSKKQQLYEISKELNNLNKTFGGEKFRNTIGPIVQDNYFNFRKEQPRQEINKQQRNENISGIVFGLERILKGLQQNQKIIQNMSPDSENGSTKNTRPVFNQISYNSSGIATSNPMYNLQNGLQGNQSTNSMTNFYKASY